MSTEHTPEPVRCPECTAYNGKHCFDCSLQTVEEKIAWGPYYHAAWLRMQQRDSDYGIRLRAQVTLWQGKHALLRHENNKLRKKVRALPAEQPEIVARLRVMVNDWTSSANGSLKWAESQGLMNREILTDFGRLGRCASELEQLLDNLSPVKQENQPKDIECSVTTGNSNTPPQN